MSAVSLVEPRIADKKQSLSVLIPDGLPLVRADTRRLKQIAINLLSNAHKFTLSGGKIMLAAARIDGRFVAITVRDSGIGMSPEQLVLAMKPFGQVNSSHARTHEGTGLGLPITKALVEQHGGRMWIDSTEGQGTTIVFTIPAEESTR